MDMGDISFTLFQCPWKTSQSPSNKQAMETHESNIHIGHLIQAQLKADKRSVGWLSREIGCTRNHVYKIFNRPSLDADLILKISFAMNFNFFQYYTAEFLEAMKARMGEE